MKYVKSHYESALTDGHVQLILMTGNTNFEPQLREMLSLLHNKRIPFLIRRPILWKTVLSYYYYY